MKWKQKGCKQANKEMGKFDYTLWYGTSEHDYYQVQGLIRGRRVKRRSQANCQDREGHYISSEQLCFGSVKAARRWVLKHQEWLIMDYRNRNGGRKPKFVKIIPWRGRRNKDMTIPLVCLEIETMVLRCKRLGGREVPKSCHVLNGRKEFCKELFFTDEKQEIPQFMI